MDSGYKTILWGLVLKFFHINFGRFQVLPDFMCWLIIFYGMKTLYEESKNNYFRKANYIVLIIATISFIDFSVKIAGLQVYYFDYLSMLTVVLTLPFLYWMMVGSIESLKSMGEEEAAREFLRSLRIYLVIYILNTVYGCGVIFLENSTYTLLFMVIGVIQYLWFMIMVNRLKSLYTNNTEEGL